MKKILSIWLLLVAVSVHSQEMLGLVTGNYAGSNGIYLNPSSIANSKIRWDLNLFSANAFVFNNYFYLPKRQAGFFSVVSGEYTFPAYPKPFGVGERNVHVYYKDKSSKNIFTNGRIIGPSAMFRCGDHTLAVHTGLRVMSSSYNIPYDIANFSYFTLDYKPQHYQNYKRDKYYHATMSLAEIGFSYATMIKRSFFHRWAAGGTVNFLVGNNGAYINGGYTDYVAFNDSILTVNELNGDFGLAIPFNHHTNELELTDNLIKGFGFSMDLGITYYYAEKGNRRPLKDGAYQKKFEPYTFKLGLALVDIGYVRFSKHSVRHIYEHARKRNINVQLLEWDNLHTELRELSEIFFDDPEHTYAGDSFSIFLPTAFTLHADYKFKESLYLGGIIIAPVRFTNPQIRRPMTIAVLPRFETRYLEVSVPVSLYDLKYPRIGFSIRIHDLTVGTDRLSGFLSNYDFTGMDLYVSYKINFNGHSSRKKNSPCKW